VTTARDIRDAEWVCRSNASNLRRFATPVALDPLASAHNMRLAVLWEDMADAHAEYAAELEGEENPATSPVQNVTGEGRVSGEAARPSSVAQRS
jgi:hypothetical protein